MFLYSYLGRKLTGHLTQLKTHHPQEETTNQATLQTPKVEEDLQAIEAPIEVIKEKQESSGFIRVMALTVIGVSVWYYAKRSDFSG